LPHFAIRHEQLEGPTVAGDTWIWATALIFASNLSQHVLYGTFAPVIPALEAKQWVLTLQSFNHLLQQ
jgi:hypothetical protein